MGSVGGFEKGETPFLDRIKQHNKDYHRSLILSQRAAPVYLKLLVLIGVTGPMYKWVNRNQYKCWPEKETNV